VQLSIRADGARMQRYQASLDHRRRGEVLQPPDIGRHQLRCVGGEYVHDGGDQLSGIVGSLMRKNANKRSSGLGKNSAFKTKMAMVAVTENRVYAFNAKGWAAQTKIADKVGDWSHDELEVTVTPGKMSTQFVAGICIPVIPALAWLIMAGAGPYLYESWVYYPLARYPERFARPFPDFFPLAPDDFDLWVKLVIFMPVVVYPLAIAAIGWTSWRFQNRRDLVAKHEGHALLAITSVGLLTLLQSWPRADVTSS